MPAATRPSLIYRPPSYVERLDLAHIFPRAQPLELELGAGDGTLVLALLAPGSDDFGRTELAGQPAELDLAGRVGRRDEHSELPRHGGLLSGLAVGGGTALRAATQATAPAMAGTQAVLWGDGATGRLAP